MLENMRNTSNEDLMCRVAAGDKPAFEALVYRHQRPVFNFFFRFLGDRAEAEDLTQEVFLRVWKSAGTYKPQAQFTTWLYRIALNLGINRQRSLRIRNWFTPSEPASQLQKSNETFIGQTGVTSTTPEDDVIQMELSQQMRKALDGLPTSQRVALILKIYDGWTYLEISQIMGRSVSAVDSLLIRAKKNLRKKIHLNER
jgi:RNA polymerase sigma-70 factor (ECF subfamily)